MNNQTYSMNPYLNRRLINDTSSAYRQINCYQLCSRSSLLLNSSVNEQAAFKRDCQTACPHECESIEYSTKTEAVDYLPSAYRLNASKFTIGLNNYISNMSDSFLRSRLLNLYIYIDDLKYTEVTQIPKMTASDFISSIGGSLSLFLGVSMLSFAEVVDFFMFLVVGFKDRRKVFPCKAKVMI